MYKWLGLPPLASVHGGELDQLIMIVHVLMALLFVGWGAFFIYTLVRFRSAKNPKANYEGVKNHSSRYIEVAGGGFEAFFFICFFISLLVARVYPLPGGSKARVVRGGGGEVGWEVAYPRQDRGFG